MVNVMVILDPTAADLLAVLDGARVPWGIVTNGSRSQVLKVRKLGLESRAACVLVSEEVGFRKPDPAIFRLAAERLGIAPVAALFIGDHPDADVVGAAGTGMRTAWLRRGREWPTRLESTPPDYSIDSFADLYRALGIQREKRFRDTLPVANRQRVSSLIYGPF